jgi:hypothetical protein
MTWDRAKVASSLVALLQPATGVQVHPRPPETLNPPCIVVSRPQPVAYGTAGFSVDEATLPLVIVGGIENEDAIEATKNACRAALLANPGLSGMVQQIHASEERNWRNMTGAGGIQLLMCELILTIQM